MTTTEDDWRECLRRMDAHAEQVREWPAAEPDPDAVRCVASRHRTLAHLRACQETWLDACVAFVGQDRPRLKLLHPWRVFAQRVYQQVPWDTHHAAYLADRERWTRLLEIADRSRSGRINGQEHSIESLTRRLVAHEHHHLFSPR